MGDSRFAAYYHQVKEASDTAAAIRDLADEGVVAALAAASRSADPYLANVLASEALNRIRLKDAITRTLGEGVFAVSREGRLTFMNPAAERMLGLRAETLLGQEIHDVLHPPGKTDVHEPCALVAALDHGETVREDDTVLATSDGTVLTVSLIVSPVMREGDIDGAVVAFQDIRARKEAEDRLRRSERRLATAQQIAHVGSWEWELATGRIRWSDEMYRIHGMPNGDEPMTAERYLEALHPSERGELQKLLAERLKNPMPFEQEQRLTRPDGSVRHIFYRGDILVDAQGEPVSLIGTAQDITSRKQAEEHLERLLRDRERIMETIPDILYECDAQGRLQIWNRRLAQATGLTADDLWRRPLTVILAPRDRDVMARALEECRSGAPFEVEAALASRHADPAPYEWRGVALHGEDGDLVGFLGTARDISARRRAEEEVRQSEERFRLLARATRDTVYDWDLQTDKLWWNDNFWDLTGRERGSLEPDIAWWTGQIHPDDRARVVESLHEALTGNAEAWSDEYRFAREDGSYVHVFDRAYIMRSDGRAIRLVGAMMDLGRHKTPSAIKDP